MNARASAWYRKLFPLINSVWLCNGPRWPFSFNMQQYFFFFFYQSKTDLRPRKGKKWSSCQWHCPFVSSQLSVNTGLETVTHSTLKCCGNQQLSWWDRNKNKLECRREMYLCQFRCAIWVARTYVIIHYETECSHFTPRYHPFQNLTKKFLCWDVNTSWQFDNVNNSPHNNW